MMTYFAVRQAVRPFDTLRVPSRVEGQTHGPEGHRRAHRPEQAEGLGTYEAFAHSARFDGLTVPSLTEGLSPEGISSSLDFPRDDPEPVEESSSHI